MGWIGQKRPPDKEVERKAPFRLCKAPSVVAIETRAASRSGAYDAPATGLVNPPAGLEIAFQRCDYTADAGQARCLCPIAAEHIALARIDQAHRGTPP